MADKVEDTVVDDGFAEKTDGRFGPTNASQTTSEAEKEVRQGQEQGNIDRDLERDSVPYAKSNHLDKKEPESQANLVDWDGPDDPSSPMNWPRGRKLLITISISMITFLTPLGSSMFAPGVPNLMEDFKSDNETIGAFVVSVYLLGYCFGPLLIAPLSEMYGRRPLYNACNILFTIFNIACAVAPDMASLIVFRLFAGLAGSCPLTLGAGTLADMIAQENRGAAMAAWALGPLLGPVIGPFAGGYLTQAKGWRWTFWVLAIAGGAVTISTFISARESYAYVILARKAKRLRKETGNQNLRSVLDTGRSPRELFIFSIVRPTKMLLFSPIVFLLSLYVAIIYGYLYLLFTTLTEVFEGQYGFSQGSVGLAYLGIGVGSLIGLAILGASSDRLLKYLTKKNGGVSKPEYRLPPLFVGACFIPLSLFWYGWTAEKQDAWILPILGTACLGVGMLICFMCTSTYLVDAYTVYSASAIAANTVLRSLVGALLPLAGNRMYAALGLGWGNSLLAFIALAMVPLPFIFYKYGEQIRNSKLFKVEF